MAMFAAHPPGPVPVLERPATWLALDLETGDAPEEAIDAAIAAWRPPANVKDPAKLEARRHEAAARIRERAALLDASPILCAAVQTATERLLFNGLDETDHAIAGWTVLSYGSERSLLTGLRDWLNARADLATVLIGHHLRGFDLPKLRAAYVRQRLRLPMAIAPRWGLDAQAQATVDTMALFRSFSMEHRDEFAVSLDTVAAALGIPRPKAVVSGADVPRLHREGCHAEILTYCAVDCATTTRAWQLMASDALDMD